MHGPEEYEHNTGLCTDIKPRYIQCNVKHLYKARNEDFNSRLLMFNYTAKATAAAETVDNVYTSSSGQL